ncbi:MAG: hypothetical protein AAF224_13220 [Pseudomonadota bacterium]
MPPVSPPSASTEPDPIIIESESPDVAPPVETRHPQLTPLQKLLRNLGDFALGAGRMAALCLVLTPIVLTAILVIDIPFRLLDQVFTSAAMRPSGWLTNGHIVMAFGAMAVILIARRFGGDEAARTVTAAWSVAAVAAFAEFTYLAPLLEGGDLPSTRFVVGFVASAMVGQYVAAAFYDIVRGGEVWWRAPFYALLTAFAVHVALFYPIAFGASNAPWMAWMVIDFGLKAVMAVAFLGAYALLRKQLRPRGGLGG